jgi:hypothetical protein
MRGDENIIVVVMSEGSMEVLDCSEEGKNMQKLRKGAAFV